MANTLISKSDYTITVNSSRPITVKNQIREVRSIESIPGVNSALRVDGATIIYNANTNQYDIKPYDFDALLNLDRLYVSQLFANNSTGSNGQVLSTNGNTVYWANTVTKITAGPGISGGGSGDSVLVSVNTAYIATITANNSLFAYGKRESDLSVSFATFAGTANFAYTANTATFFDGVIDCGSY